MPSEWVSGDRSDTAQWDYGTTGDVAYHRVYRQTQLLWSENSDQAEWGYYYWATKNEKGMTYQSGQDVVVRGQFINNGTLANTQDSNYRAINDDWPVFGFSFDLGSVGSRAANALFTIGLCQDQAIQFLGSNGIESVPSLWTSYFSHDTDAVGLSRAREEIEKAHGSSTDCFIGGILLWRLFPRCWSQCCAGCQSCSGLYQGGW